MKNDPAPRSLIRACRGCERPGAPGCGGDCCGKPGPRKPASDSSVSRQLQNRTDGNVTSESRPVQREDRAQAKVPHPVEEAADGRTGGQTDGRAPRSPLLPAAGLRRWSQLSRVHRRALPAGPFLGREPLAVGCVEVFQPRTAQDTDPVATALHLTQQGTPPEKYAVTASDPGSEEKQDRVFPATARRQQGSVRREA